MIAQPDKEILISIAEELELGLNCFYHINTSEVIALPEDIEEMRDIAGDVEHWEEMSKEIEKHPENYIRITAPDSHTCFQFMERFIASLPENKISNSLFLSISKKQPFQRFKECLLDYPGIRQKWFVFKTQCYIEYIQTYFSHQEINAPQASDQTAP